MVQFFQTISTRQFTVQVIRQVLAMHSKRVLSTRQNLHTTPRYSRKIRLEQPSQQWAHCLLHSWTMLFIGTVEAGSSPMDQIVSESMIDQLKEYITVDYTVRTSRNSPVKEQVNSDSDTDIPPVFDEFADFEPKRLSKWHRTPGATGNCSINNKCIECYTHNYYIPFYQLRGANYS